MEEQATAESIPKIDGKLVEGHVAGGARVRGYLHMTYLPPPEKEHSDFYHSCHEFTPEESKELSAEGLPLLFNHDGKHDIVGQISVDHLLEGGEGKRNALAILHGPGDLDGECISSYLDRSLQSGRYKDVSLQHMYYLDGAGVKKRALEISICRDRGRRPGARILSYKPASSKKSYIKPKSCAGRSAAMSSNTDPTSNSSSTSSDNTPSGVSTVPAASSSSNSTESESMQVDNSTPAATTPEAAPETPLQRKEEAVPDLGKASKTELMEMAVQTQEAKRRVEEELAELRKFREEKLQQEAAERARLQAEEEKRLKDLAESYAQAMNERFETTGPNGEKLPGMDSDLQQDLMQLANDDNPESRRARLQRYLTFASAAAKADVESAKRQREEAELLEQESKKRRLLQERMSAASAPLASPSSRFNNLPQAVGQNLINSGQARGFHTPQLSLRSAAASQPGASGGDAASKLPSAVGKTQKEAFQEYSKWYATEGFQMSTDEAEHVLNNLVGTSAASAGGIPVYNTPRLELSMQYADPEGFERLKERMIQGSRSQRVPAYSVIRS